MVNYRKIFFATRANNAMKASEIPASSQVCWISPIYLFCWWHSDPDLFSRRPRFRTPFAEALRRGRVAAQGCSIPPARGQTFARLDRAQMQAIGIACDAGQHSDHIGSRRRWNLSGPAFFLSPGDRRCGGRPIWGPWGPLTLRARAYDKLGSVSNRSGAEPIPGREGCQAGRRSSLYLSVDFATPTVPQSAAPARERVIDLAEGEWRSRLIEDAAYQSLRFRRGPDPRFLALEAAVKGGDLEACRTIYCGSFSKTLSPGLARWGGLCRHFCP